MKLLGGEAGKAFFQIEAHLMSEDADSARSRAIVFTDALVQHALQKIQILFHFTVLFKAQTYSKVGTKEMTDSLKLATKSELRWQAYYIRMLIELDIIH